MGGRLTNFSLATLWGLFTPVLLWSADSAQLLAQLGNFDIVNVNQVQLQRLGNTAAASDASPSPVNEVLYTRQLLGLFVDGVELPAVTAFHDGNEYLLPLVTIMDSSDVSISTDTSSVELAGIRLNTPGGEAMLNPQDLRLVDGQLMILQTALAEKLLIDVRFDQASFAIYLALPWSLSNADQVGEGVVNEAQFTPPTASIRNLRADLNYVKNGDYEGMLGDYFAAGNLAGGTWRFRVEQDGNKDATPFEYYWTRNFGNSQGLVGNSDFSLHPLLPSVEQTGIQYLFSTKALPRSTYADISRPNSSRRMANGIRDIAGVANPGAVAELRIDGGVVARVRVRLDGTYDFPNIELPTRGYSEVLVYILDRNTGTLLEEQDFSRRSGIELLGNGQHTVFASLGEQGNLLDNQYVSLGAVSAAQWRYGLTEDLTLELGHQQVGDFKGSEAAVSMAFSRQWFGSLGYAESFDRNAIGIDLEGGNDDWSFDLTAREYKLTGLLEADEEPRQWSRYLNYRYQFTDNLNLGLVGRDINTSFEQQRFVLPSASWSNHNNLSVSAYPNYRGSYRVDSRYTPTYRDTARYAYESNRHLIDYRHRNDRGQEYYANYRADDEFQDRFELGIINYSDNSLLGRTQIGLVSSNGELGYTLDWESRLLPGFNSRLRLAKGGLEFGAYEEEDEDEIYVQWQMTLDFAVAQNRIVPADSTWGSLDRAALTGEVLIGGERVTSEWDIDKIELLINGDSHTALVQGGRYYIEGLEPGLHKISIDSRFLPIELMPGANQSYWVRLEAAAATEVPIVLEARFAIAGRVRNVNGENMVGEQLNILNASGRKVGEAYTDQYGLYRADNLAPGDYYVIVERQGERVAAIEIAITDSFLFEQDIVVP